MTFIEIYASTGIDHNKRQFGAPQIGCYPSDNIVHTSRQTSITDNYFKIPFPSPTAQKLNKPKLKQIDRMRFLRDPANDKTVFGLQGRQ